MIITGLLGHFSEVYVKQGDKVPSGGKLGRMGDTGACLPGHNHVHAGFYPGAKTEIFRMNELQKAICKLSQDKMTELFRQVHYTLDYMFFGITEEEKKNGINILFTSGYGEPDYTDPWKFHAGWDCVPSDRHRTTEHWIARNSRSKPMEIIKTSKESGYDSGYGNYILFQIRV